MSDLSEPTQPPAGPIMWKAIDKRATPENEPRVHSFKNERKRTERFEFFADKETEVPVVFGQTLAGIEDFEVFDHRGNRIRAVKPRSIGAVTMAHNEVIAKLTELTSVALAARANQLGGHSFNDASPRDRMIAVLLTNQAGDDDTDELDDEESGDVILLPDGNGSLTVGQQREALSMAGGVEAAEEDEEAGPDLETGDDLDSHRAPLAPSDDVADENTGVLHSELPGAKTSAQLLKEAMGKGLVPATAIKKAPGTAAAVERVARQQRGSGVF